MTAKEGLEDWVTEKCEFPSVKARTQRVRVIQHPRAPLHFQTAIYPPIGLAGDGGSFQCGLMRVPALK